MDVRNALHRCLRRRIADPLEPGVVIQLADEGGVGLETHLLESEQLPGEGCPLSAQVEEDRGVEGVAQDVHSSEGDVDVAVQGGE